ncbi:MULTISPECIES: HAD family hydrolase [unclassified Nitratiruptor]|uniref:KdsC family phosphatase n=1 Tax=unclassified Nitratiruptor TaxID=2624044 RepID=UPI0019150F42|nr:MULTISPECIES: HAD-IIIA family hydrolase [unclassified Nitratiruptor]BCD60501.1 3-deoxy-D-manno-octulosonate 8-phosphate phosphatase (KDO 8-P phosphatase) [Nitratiruptor sp. YY08-10]BCD64010.1 3-deoxy-D-manno-octulosonate 8-phosphate phosphatase (KDO 8-P phosphatase) [Nitratiruptor sp. YY08-14]
MIELLVLDVDGCMTDGSITYTNALDEAKSFNVKDGFAIVQWLRLGKKVAIITGRTSKIVEYRAKELGIPYLYQRVQRKEEKLFELCQKLSIPLENVAAIGDDLNDYRLLKLTGLSFAPVDAIDFIKENVDVVLSKGGGKGAVREMIEYLLQQEGLYEEYLSFWIGE